MIAGGNDPLIDMVPPAKPGGGGTKSLPLRGRWHGEAVTEEAINPSGAKNVSQNKSGVRGERPVHVVLSERSESKDLPT